MIKITKKRFLQATIISILISSNKMIISLNDRDQILWLIYIIVRNLNVKIEQSQKRPKTLLLNSIFIVYE